MRSIKCTLDRLFDFLIEKEIISESPLKEIYYKKTPATTITRNHQTPHEIERLLEAIKRYSPGYLYPIIKLFAETGAKVTEVVQLKWADVECIKRTVEFHGTDRSQSLLGTNYPEVHSLHRVTTEKSEIAHQKQRHTSPRLR